MNLFDSTPMELLFGFFEIVALALSLAGVCVIAGGTMAATYRALRSRPARDEERYARYRREIGRAILLGLEFMVAADIVETVSVAPTIEKVIVLAGIVLIRTFLSLALEVELKGHWPWQASTRTRD